MLSERTNDGDSLTSRLDPDTSQNEQTWPSEEEMQGIDGASNGGGGAGSSLPPAKSGTTPKVVRKVKVPKGTSAYQAAWILEGDEDGEDDGDDGYTSDDGPSGSEEEMEEIDAEGFKIPNIPAHPNEDGGDGDEVSVNSKRSVAFEDLDMEEEGRQYAIVSPYYFIWLDYTKLTYALSWVLDSTTGAQNVHAIGRRKTTSNSQTRWTLREMLALAPVSSGSVASDPSVQALGIHMRIYLSITQEYSNSKTMNVRRDA